MSSLYVFTCIIYCYFVGLGGFCTQDVVEQQYFAVFEGKKISFQDQEKLSFEKSRYTVKMGNQYIDGTDPVITETSRINDYYHAVHKTTGKSATPNCVMVERTVNGETRMCLRALRYICQDEEFFYKYEWAPAIWSRIEKDMTTEKKRLDCIACDKYTAQLETYLNLNEKKRKNQVIRNIVATVDRIEVFDTDLKLLQPGLKINDNVRFVLYVLITVCHTYVKFRL